PHRLRGDGGSAQRLGDPLELRGREDVEAAFLALRDHQSSRKFLAVLGRQEQPPLLVQAWRMSAKKHRHSPPAPRMAAAAASRPTPIPLRTTVPHIPPPSTRTASLDAPQAHERAVQKSGAEWENAAVDGPTTVNPRRESHVNRPGRTVSTQGLSVRPVPSWRRADSRGGRQGQEGSRGGEKRGAPIPGATPAIPSTTWCAPPTASPPPSSPSSKGRLRPSGSRSRSCSPRGTC